MSRIGSPRRALRPYCGSMAPRHSVPAREAARRDARALLARACVWRPKRLLLGCADHAAGTITRTQLETLGRRSHCRDPIAATRFATHKSCQRQCGHRLFMSRSKQIQRLELAYRLIE